MQRTLEIVLHGGLGASVPGKHVKKKEFFDAVKKYLKLGAAVANAGPGASSGGSKQVSSPTPIRHVSRK